MIDGARASRGESSRTPSPQIAKRLCRWLIFAVLGAFLVATFSDALTASWERLHHKPVQLSWHLVAALVLFVSAVPISGLLWGSILERMEQTPVRKAEAMWAHVVSWLLKYIPGQIGSFAYKVYWGGKHRLRPGTIALSFFYENVFLQIASLIPAVIILLVCGDVNSATSRYILGGSAIIAMMIVGLAIIRPASEAILRCMRKMKGFNSEALPFLPTHMVAKYAALYVVPRLLNGAGFVLIAANLSELAPADVLPLAAAYVIAGAIGILAIFVPSGLGVREAIIVALAAPVIGIEVAIVAALLARFMALLADGVLLGGVALHNMTRTKQQP